MKKLLAMFVCVLVAAGMFAQTAAGSSYALEGIDSYADTTTRTIKVEDTEELQQLHPKARTSVTIELEYTPLTGEVHFYYTCLAGLFDQGEAMNTAMAVYENFAKEQGYKHYTYNKKDKTKWFKDDRKVRYAKYHSWVIFTR
ncbi:MAG: hypothetical protein J1D88_07700 [Treponema sp.]|nr:hypothetical protein [Treponema sp.]